MTLQKVTSDTNECFPDRFLNGFNRLSIPLFQRGYAWEKKQFERFREDIERAVDSEDRAVFIGTIVAIRRKTGINDPDEFEIVDGQQRLITIYLTVLAAAVVMAERGLKAEAGNLARRFLFHPDVTSSNTKLFTSRIDTQEFHNLWDDALKVGAFKEALKDSIPSPPPPSGASNPNPEIRKQFQRIRKWLASVADEQPVDPTRIQTYVTAALTHLSMVYLELQDPTSAPTIFEGLNNGGIKTTVGDLVRNEVFSRLRSKPDLAQNLFDGPWKDFEKQLGSNYLEFFFPYGLILDHQTKKSDLFSALRARWKNTDVEDIIKEMRSYVPSFNAVLSGVVGDWAEKDVKLGVSRLPRMGCLPASARPYLMQLIHETEAGKVPQAICSDILSVIENFLVRRAICGFEPTGLHAVFKGLWGDTKEILSAPAVVARIRKHKTVQWPGDDQVRQAVHTRELYGTNVIDFLASEYDRSLGGDTPPGVPQIEHIMPKSTAAGWSHISKDEHKRWLNRWANLVVCSQPLNASISNSPYEEKRKRYLDDSMYKSPRKIAETWSVWDVQSMEQRSEILADFVMNRWPTLI